MLGARERQWERYRRGLCSSATNATLGTRELERMVRLEPGGRRLLESAVRELGLSARAFAKILRVSRTVADLEQEENVRDLHVAEAIQGRLLDRELLS